MNMKNDRGVIGTGLIVAFVAAGVMSLGGLSLYSYARDQRTQAVQTEIALSAQYQSNQNNLSSYTSGFYEQLGIVKFKSEKLDQILADYAKGRNFAANGQSNQASFINAVSEAVPDLKGLDIADRMMDYVKAGRESYKNVQDKLLDQLRAYDSWREDGLVRPMVLGNFFPSDHLEARVGGQVVAAGKAARAKMYQIVLASDATKAYQSGTMEPLSVPK
jgi:hypothetical protein